MLRWMCNKALDLIALITHAHVLVLLWAMDAAERDWERGVRERWASAGGEIGGKTVDQYLHRVRTIEPKIHKQPIISGPLTGEKMEMMEMFCRKCNKVVEGRRHAWTFHNDKVNDGDNIQTGNQT